MPDPISMSIGASLSGISSLGKLIFGGKQNKMANRINPVFKQYETSPFAQRQLAIAQQMFGGRMAGAGAQEQNIFNNQASTSANINRNVGDSSRALALTGAMQGQTNEALSNLGMNEAQNKYNMLGNLNQAYGTLIGEGDKVYNSMLQKYQIDKQDQAALRESGVKNMFGGLNDLAGLFGTLGQANGFGNKSGGTNRQLTSFSQLQGPVNIDPRLINRSYGG